jgi:cell division protein ZapA
MTSNVFIEMRNDMAQKNRVRGQILDKEYTISAEETQAHLKATFELANQQLTQLKTLRPQASTEELAILLALNALSDQLKMQAKVDRT